MPRERALVAMSGGVDSSVAAARLAERGFNVVGVTLHLWDYPDDGSVRGRCCAPEDMHDARLVADQLGIFHYAFDRREMFAKNVIDPFVDAYLSGSTPSPCVACNRTVKLRELFELADRFGCSRLATGHYARVDRTSATPWLRRGRDAKKDQSYFLFALDGAALERIEFPLGDSTKAEVRAEALARGLAGAEKGESQELCFVPSGRYDAFVEDRAGDRVRPGAIVDADGRTVGTHAGVQQFTVGQRKGLGVALGEPAFVVGIDAATAEVRLGSAADLASRGALLVDTVLRPEVHLPRRALVQVRSRQAPVAATLTAANAGGGGIEVHFDEPVRAVVKGQVAVAYDGDRVLGGGVIAAPLAVDGAIVDRGLADRETADRVVVDGVAVDRGSVLKTRRYVVIALAVACSGCSLADGEGAVKSDSLYVAECWNGPFDLGPNFFAAVPYRRTLTIRVQKGGDLEEVSDGMTILVDDIDAVRANLDVPMKVGLPSGVTVPGVPLVAQTDPPLIHASIYLNRACHAQNSVLYSIGGSMTFHHIFDGDPNETSATEKLTDADFADIRVADPRDSPAGTLAPRHVSMVTGFFRFYFERGQPGQPFP